jgi:hypothetical protein
MESFTSEATSEAASEAASSAESSFASKANSNSSVAKSDGQLLALSWNRQVSCSNVNM